MLARGGRVASLDLDAEAVDELRAAHATAVADGRLIAAVGDVGHENDVAHALGAAVDAFGELSGVVHNAGIGAGGPIEELRVEDWRRVIDTNLGGLMLCAKHGAPALRAARGAIVAIASTRALMSEPDTEAYAASKGGIVALTHALAASLGPDVRVNAVSPGWIEVRDRKKRAQRREPELRPIDHAQHLVGRVGRPEDIADAVLYLLSDAAGFVTGQNWVIDGGMTKTMIYAP